MSTTTTATTYISRLSSPAFPVGNLGNWQTRHLAAIRRPQGSELPILGMLSAWLLYADSHRERFDDGIGEDYVLGPEWEIIGRCLLGLLNGETGRLDCGTLDGLIRSVLVAEGFTEEA